MSAFPFIDPAARSRGPDWLHEVKFDGYRIKIHKVGNDVAIFSRNGHDFTTRFADIAYLLRDLPAKTAILDGELVASDRAGVPDFAELHRRTAAAGHAAHVGVRPALAQRPGLAALQPREAPGAPRRA